MDAWKKVPAGLLLIQSLNSGAFAQTYTIQPGQRIDFTNGVSVQCQSGGGGVERRDCFCSGTAGGNQSNLGYRYVPSGSTQYRQLACFTDYPALGCSQVADPHSACETIKFQFAECR